MLSSMTSPGLNQPIDLDGTAFMNIRGFTLSSLSDLIIL